MGHEDEEDDDDNNNTNNNDDNDDGDDDDNGNDHVSQQQHTRAVRAITTPSLSSWLDSAFYLQLLVPFCQQAFQWIYAMALL